MGKRKQLLSDEEYYSVNYHSPEALAINALREAARLAREACMDWDTAEGTMRVEWDYRESKNAKQY